LEESLNAKLNRVRFSTTDEEKTPLGEVLWSLSYDRDGNIVESVTRTDDGPHKFVTSFDKHGWEVDADKFVSGRLVLHTRYAYDVDERGNWVKQFATSHLSTDRDQSFLPVSITYRAITYHED
jgi:hypothetical protein